MPISTGIQKKEESADSVWLTYTRYVQGEVEAGVWWGRGQQGQLRAHGIVVPPPVWCC